MKKDGYRFPTIPKREFLRMMVRSLLLTAVAVPSLLLLSNYSTHHIVADSLWGSASKEKPAQLTENIVPHADVIAVLGGGLQPNGEEYDLNRFQKRRERAAAIGVVEFGMSDRVLLLDGLKPDGADILLTKNFFIEQVNLLSQGQFVLPEESITVESRSTSTATNLDELKKYMEKNRLESAIVVTDEFHRVRTEALIKIKNINATVITVEQLIALHDPWEMIEINKQNTEKEKEWRISEWVKKTSLFFDPQGEITAEVESLFQ